MKFNIKFTIASVNFIQQSISAVKVANSMGREAISLSQLPRHIKPEYLRLSSSYEMQISASSCFDMTTTNETGY